MIPKLEPECAQLYFTTSYMTDTGWVLPMEEPA